MRSALLHFPYGEVFATIEKICTRNKFRIIDSNQKKGEINAEKGSTLIGNKVLLHLKVLKTDKPVTKVIVEVEVKGRMKKFLETSEIEEKIIDSIYRHF